MSTSMIITSGDSIARMSDDDLVQSLFQAPLTDEEYNSFLLSVTTQFNIQDSNRDLSPHNEFSQIDLLDSMESWPWTHVPPTPLDETFVTKSPKDFILECGLDPSEFHSLQKPPSQAREIEDSESLYDVDLWDRVLKEVFHKMTECAKSANLSFANMDMAMGLGFDVHDLAILDNFSVTA